MGNSSGQEAVLNRNRKRGERGPGGEGDSGLPRIAIRVSQGGEPVSAVFVPLLSTPPSVECEPRGSSNFSPPTKSVRSLKEFLVLCHFSLVIVAIGKVKPWVVL